MYIIILYYYHCVYYYIRGKPYNYKSLSQYNSPPRRGVIFTAILLCKKVCSWLCIFGHGHTWCDRGGGVETVATAFRPFARARVALNDHGRYILGVLAPNRRDFLVSSTRYYNMLQLNIERYRNYYYHYMRAEKTPPPPPSSHRCRLTRAGLMCAGNDDITLVVIFSIFFHSGHYTRDICATRRWTNTIFRDVFSCKLLTILCIYIYKTIRI